MAAKTIIRDLYIRFRLSEVLGDSLDRIILAFTPTKIETRRSCKWRRYKNTLQVEVTDRTLDEGIKLVAATMARAGIKRHPKRLIRQSWLADIVVLFHIVGMIMGYFVVPGMIQRYGMLSIDLAFNTSLIVMILGFGIYPLLGYWYSRIHQRRVHALTAELQHTDLYSSAYEIEYYVKKLSSAKWILVVIGAIIEIIVVGMMGLSTFSLRF